MKNSCSPKVGLWVSAILAVAWLAREASSTGIVTVEALLTAAASLALWALVFAGVIGVYNRLRRR